MTDNKVIVWMQTSLDGYTQGPGGEFDWPMVGPEMHAHLVDTLRDAGTFCYGRKVFEMMAGFWPTADEDPDSTPLQAEYARIWRPMPKLVFSRTLDTSDWNTAVAREVTPVAVADQLGATPGDLYVFGGSETVSALVEQDLVDEFQLFVHPVVLGGGTPFFPHSLSGAGWPWLPPRSSTVRSSGCATRGPSSDEAAVAGVLLGLRVV
jgi:dihydrofolate reductase